MEHPNNNREKTGSPGASARREHERRKGRREQRARQKHPRLGGLLLALNGSPQHERRWEHGAEGEELVAAALATRCNGNVVLLHDRRLPGRRANIDHIAVAPSGVWVIDTKRYKGKVEVTHPLFGKPKLRIGGRDQTKLVESLAAQVELVNRATVDIKPAAPVHGCFCFVGAELPLLSTPTIHGFPCLTRRGLDKRLNAVGPLGADEVGSIARHLLSSFPPA